LVEDFLFHFFSLHEKECEQTCSVLRLDHSFCGRVTLML
jgi:hypothetical protein